MQMASMFNDKKTSHLQFIRFAFGENVPSNNENAIYIQMLELFSIKSITK